MANKNSTKAEILTEYKRKIKQANESGIDVPFDIAKLGNANTKTELLSALKILDASINEAGSKNKNPKGDNQLTLDDITYPQEEKEYELGDDVDAAREDRGDNTDNSPQKINDAYANPGEENELKLLNSVIVGKIHSLEQAKVLCQREFEELLELEQGLEKIVIMFNDAKSEVSSLEGENNKILEDERRNSAERIESLETELELKIKNAEEELVEFENEADAEVIERDKIRETEQEQYSYELISKQKKEDDIWEDDLEKRQANIKNTEEEIKKLSEQLVQQEKLLPELNSKMEELQNLLEKAEARGAQERQRELDAEHEHQVTVFKMDSEAEIQALESQIKSIKEDYESLAVEKNIIQEKLDKAYAESNKLYLQTIQSTGGVKIIGNLEKK